MTDVWSQRADAFRDSPTHREGPDLDLLVEWCEPGHDVKVLDVATMSVKGKPKRRGYSTGFRRSWKKAIVEVREGDSIPIFQGLEADL